ncbi:hypothetical protein [Desulfovibrio sp. X2]|uniref:hypothetical protein n=1 Tax=Desulfovibrio sp. X2 TaxID=941449 RepID=UPI0012679509|nr:hypothetical protein [Desulfovibrio sp. X2]
MTQIGRMVQPVKKAGTFIRAFYEDVPEECRWFFLIAWLLGVPPVLSEGVRSILRTCIGAQAEVVFFIYPVSIFLFSVLTMFIFAPKRKIFCVKIDSALFIISVFLYTYGSRMIENVDKSISFLLIIPFTWLFRYDISEVSALYGVLVSVVIALIILIFFQEKKPASG